MPSAKSLLAMTRLTHFDSLPTAIYCRAVAFACTGAMYLSIVKEDG